MGFRKCLNQKSFFRNRFIGIRTQPTIWCPPFVWIVCPIEFFVIKLKCKICGGEKQPRLKKRAQGRAFHPNSAPLAAHLREVETALVCTRQSLSSSRLFKRTVSASFWRWAAYTWPSMCPSEKELKLKSGRVSRRLRDQESKTWLIFEGNFSRSEG